MASEPPAPRRAVYFRNWLSLAGGIVALGGLFSFLLLFAIDLFAHHGNPYMGILAYVVAPGFLFLGVFLMLLGRWIQLRHRRKVGAGALSHPLVIDLSRPRDKRVLAGFLIGGVVFLLITAIGSN